MATGVARPQTGTMRKPGNLKRASVALLAALAVAAVLVIVTGGASARVSPAGAGGRASAASPLSTTRIVDALAADGIGVYSSATSKKPIKAVTRPASPLRLLLWQVQRDVAQIAAGGGASGEDLNTLAQLPADSPPFAYLLAAYAEGHSTPGEVLAGELLGSQDLATPDTVVFPTLVQTLFAADAARAEQHGGTKRRSSDAVRTSHVRPTSNSSLPRAHAARSPGSVCTTIGDWASSAADKVYKALSVSTPSSPALAFLSGIWNRAVAAASAAISGLASALTKQLTSIVARSLGVVGVASMAVSMLQNLKLTLMASPAANSFGIQNPPAHTGNTGTVKATLGKVGGLDWPGDLLQCAKKVFDIDLPSLNDVSGDKVAWTTQSTGSGASLATVTHEDDALSSDHSASLSYETGTETPDQAARGQLITTDFEFVQATVTPSAFKKLLDLVEDLTLGRLPGATTVVGPLVHALKSAVLTQITKLVQPTDFRFIQITHHRPPAALPARTCGGLLTQGAFPGANEPETEFDEPAGPSVEASVCGAGYQAPAGTEPTKGQDTGGGILLEVASTSAEAHTIFAAEQNDSGGVSALSGFGDEAFTAYLPPGTANPPITSDSPYGLRDVWVRVANDVFRIEFTTYEGSPPVSWPLAPTVVSELCPLCKFPTSGP